MAESGLDDRPRRDEPYPLIMPDVLNLRLIQNVIELKLIKRNTKKNKRFSRERHEVNECKEL